jgi:phosphate:Na+ symporter
MTAEQARRGYALIRISDELESVADYCQNLSKYRSRMFRDGLKFSDDAKADLASLVTLVMQFAKAANEFVVTRQEAVMGDEEVRDLIRMSDAISVRGDEVRDSHLARVKDGRCDPLAGLVFSDIVVALRRIKNHTVNIIDARIGRWEERREALRDLERDATRESARFGAAS